MQSMRIIGPTPASAYPAQQHGPAASTVRAAWHHRASSCALWPTQRRPAPGERPRSRWVSWVRTSVRGSRRPAAPVSIGRARTNSPTYAQALHWPGPTPCPCGQRPGTPPPHPGSAAFVLDPSSSRPLGWLQKNEIPSFIQPREDGFAERLPKSFPCWRSSLRV